MLRICVLLLSIFCLCWVDKHGVCVNVIFTLMNSEYAPVNFLDFFVKYNFRGLVYSVMLPKKYQIWLVWFILKKKAKSRLLMGHILSYYYDCIMGLCLWKSYDELRDFWIDINPLIGLCFFSPFCFPILSACWPEGVWLLTAISQLP